MKRKWECSELKTKSVEWEGKRRGRRHINTLWSSVCYLQHYTYVQSGSASPFCHHTAQKESCTLRTSLWASTLWHTVHGFLCCCLFASCVVVCLLFFCLNLLSYCVNFPLHSSLHILGLKWPTFLISASSAVLIVEFIWLSIIPTLQLSLPLSSSYCDKNDMCKVLLSV